MPEAGTVPNSSGTSVQAPSSKIKPFRSTMVTGKLAMVMLFCFATVRRKATQLMMLLRNMQFVSRVDAKATVYRGS
jgi:hypothetical protein